MTPKELLRFVGRENPFSEQQSNGSYFPIKRKITLDDLDKHLKGEITLGSYVIREDGNVNFAIIDVDVDKDLLKKNPELLKTYKILSENIFDLFPDFERCLEFSGRRGYHIWVFPESIEKPAFIRELIKTRLRANNIRNMEVYPKQDNTTGLNKGLGNLMKLPCGKHKKGGWSEILKWDEAIKNV